MDVLVIGGTGVFSSVAASLFVRKGHRVTIVTDGHGVVEAPSGISEHLIIDRGDFWSLKNALARDRRDTWGFVLDAACYNKLQARQLYSLINKRVEHLAVISTSIIYDRRNSLPLTEESQIGPRIELGSYGVGKVEMEKFWQKKWKQEHFPVTIFRPPHILGRGCELGIIPMHNRDSLLINRLKLGLPLLLADGGRQILQVVFNEDLADIIYRAARSRVTFGKVYNCACPELMTARHYYEHISNLLEKPASIRCIPSEVLWGSSWGWSPCTVPRIMSMDLMAHDLGAVPATPFSAAIETSLQYLLSRNRTLDRKDEHFESLFTEIEGEFAKLTESVDRASKERLKGMVDRRMNENPAKFIDY